MDVENELSLLTAITDILDSTDDESLSPFDTIPDSELLTSPRECDNSSVWHGLWDRRFCLPSLVWPVKIVGLPQQCSSFEIAARPG